MSKKFFIETFGCQMNDLDSEKIAGNLLHHGMAPAEDPAQADMIILNTCSVRDKAVQKVYARLGEIKRLKIQRKEVVVAVVGCMAQLEGEKILKRAPYVNILAGPQKGNVMSRLVEQSGNSRPVIELRSDDIPESLETPYIFRGNAWRAGVTISEGCNRKCAFCVVPTTRGKERNRRSEDVLREIQDLSERGYVEVLLLGQTVNSYRDPAANMSFAGLLKRVAETGGIRRIRFTSPHPVDFTDELLEVMIACPQICNQIHLPVQSGSTRILKAMRRGYTRESYLRMIETIRSASRPIAISTDIIVGYPGERDEDFLDTLSLLDAVQYDSAFSFKYSPRPNTAAFNVPDDVPDEEKRKRLDVVQKRQKEIQSQKNAEWIGRRLEVLVEDKARSRVSLTGRSSDNRIVNFDGPENLIGYFAQVEISGSSPNSLKGVWIQSEVFDREAKRASVGCPN
jgi:tRNA-2-methylthio-N6-dimethylallyladenosine synthase